MRMKMIVGNLIAVLLVGLGSYMAAYINVNKQAADSARFQVETGQEVFARSFRLLATEFVNQTEDQAATCSGPFSSTNPDAIRDRGFEAAQSVASWFSDPARGLSEQAPNVVALTDTRGRVIVRNMDRHRMRGQDLREALPGLGGVLSDGRARFDVWSKDDGDETLYLGTAMAPVRGADQRILGALIVGYDLSNGMVESEASAIGHEVAIVTSSGVYSSSLDAEINGQLGSALRADSSRERMAAALEEDDDSGRSSPWNVELQGQEYEVVLSPLPMTPSAQIAYAVLANVTTAQQAAGWTIILLVLLILSAVLVVVWGWYLGNEMSQPLEQMEDDILAIINGATDRRIDIESLEYGGLAYRINQLVNMFMGVAEEDREGRISQIPGAPDDSSWQDAAFGEGTPSPEALKAPRAPVSDDAAAAALAAEPEGEYWTRVYKEYVAAKSAQGEDVSNIPEERFVKRMKGNAAALKSKHGCSMVRFRVTVDGDQVILQPVIIP